MLDFELTTTRCVRLLHTKKGAGTFTRSDPFSRILVLLKNEQLLGFVVMFHSYDYISLFVPFFDIPVSLGSLFQWIVSINDRF